MNTARRIDLKNYEDGQEYTEDEIKSLKDRWSDNDKGQVAAWINAGGRRVQAQNSRPDCVHLVCHPMRRGIMFYDLRGIALMHEGVGMRSKDAPRIDLTYARFEHANLQDAVLDDADLSYSHFEHAILHGITAVRARLVRARLQKADLSTARLNHAKLHFAYIQNANMFKANLENADLTGADVRGANFSAVYVDNTVFRDVQWRPRPKREPRPELFAGFDVRGIRYSDPLFDQFVRQAEFVRGSRNVWPWLAFWAWSLTCSCGRSIPRWLGTCAAIVFAFAILFFSYVGEGTRCVLVRPPLNEYDFWTHVYFSVVTFSTLGFGDVTPCNLTGNIAAMVEVFIGYVMLGGLISIFTMKLVPPR